VGIWVIGRVEDDFSEDLSNDLLAHALIVGNAIAPELADNPTVITIDPLVKRATSGTGVHVTVYELDGTVLADSAADPASMSNQAFRRELRAALIDGIGETRDELDGQKSVLVATRYLAPGADDVLIRAARPSQPITELLGDMRSSLLLALGVLVVLGLALSG